LDVINIFNDPIQDPPLANIQNDKPVINEPILVKPEPVTIYNTIAKPRITSGYISEGFEQKPGYSVKQGSGYKSDSGITSKIGMTAEEKAKVREAWNKPVLPNVPEEKIPSLIESIKPFDKPIKQNVEENKNQIEEMNKKIFTIMSENKKIHEDLAKQEEKKSNARHGTKMSYNKKINQYKTKIKNNNLDIYMLTQNINSIENKNI